LFLFCLLFFFFFFQAEDGIRDFHVTGVQTCALPISSKNGCRSWRTDPARFSTTCSRSWKTTPPAIPTAPYVLVIATSVIGQANSIIKRHCNPDYPWVRARLRALTVISSKHA